MKFGKRLRELRKENRLTQSETAKILGYGYTAISNYEHGRNQPSIEDLIRIANFFDVSVDYLIGATDVRQKMQRDAQVKSMMHRISELESALGQICGIVDSTAQTYHFPIPANAAAIRIQGR